MEDKITNPKEEKIINIKDATAQILDTLNTSRKELQMKLDQTKNISSNEVSNYLERISNEIQATNKLLSDSVSFLLPYDIRICQENLKILESTLREQQMTMIPKKKFAFKTRQKESQNPTKEIAQPVDFVDGTVSYGFRDQIGQRLVKLSPDLDDRDVSLTELTNCQVFLEGSPSTVHMSHIRGCRIYCGPVKTSVFIDDCQNSVLMVACQQLRLHSSFESDFYLYCTSDPIIEDCSRIRIAPYSFRYGKMERDFEKSGLNKNSNKWDSVKDFNWLAAGVHSPNWQIIPLDERIEFNDE